MFQPCDTTLVVVEVSGLLHDCGLDDRQISFDAFHVCLERRDVDFEADHVVVECSDIDFDDIRIVVERNHVDFQFAHITRKVSNRFKHSTQLISHFLQERAFIVAGVIGIRVTHVRLLYAQDAEVSKWFLVARRASTARFPVLQQLPELVAAGVSVGVHRGALLLALL